MTAVIIGAAVVLVVAIALIAYTRRPRQDSGLTSFRRHIDALSPQSRREVMDRVRPLQDNDDGDGAVGGSAEPTEPTEPIE